VSGSLLFLINHPKSDCETSARALAKRLIKKSEKEKYTLIIFLRMNIYREDWCCPSDTYWSYRSKWSVGYRDLCIDIVVSRNRPK